MTDIKGLRHWWFRLETEEDAGRSKKLTRATLIYYIIILFFLILSKRVKVLLQIALSYFSKSVSGDKFHHFKLYYYSKLVNH